MAKPAFTRRQVYKHWDPYESYKSTRESIMRGIEFAMKHNRGDEELIWHHIQRPKKKITIQTDATDTMFYTQNARFGLHGSWAGLLPFDSYNKDGLISSKKYKHMQNPTRILTDPTAKEI